MLSLFFFVLLLHDKMIFAQEQRRLNFTISEVIQCEPVLIKISSDTEEVTPLIVLTIFPFKSTPAVFNIPSFALNSTVIELKSLPLQAGDKLIASLNDEAGQLLAALSEVITVMPSLTGDETCLENPSPPLNLTGGHFDLISTPSQCKEVDVAYETGVAPTMRALIPNGNSFTLPRTSDNRNGTAKYLVNIQSGSQVLFLFDNGLDHRETTNLMTVLEDSTSRNDCLPEAPTTSETAQPFELPSTNLEEAPVPRSLIIGISVGGAVTLIIIILLVIFILCDRKRRRQRTVDGFISRSSFGNVRPLSDSGSLGTDTFEKISSIESTIGADSKERRGIDPPFVRGAWEMKNDDRPTSTSSWLYDDNWGVRGAPTYRRPSVDSMLMSDIEEMLNMATNLSRPQMCKQATKRHAMILAPYQLRESHSAAISEASEDIGHPTRYWREPPDVPADSTASGTFSTYSLTVLSRYSGGQSWDIPSPFIRGDERARTPSDIVCPELARVKEIAHR